MTTLNIDLEFQSSNMHFMYHHEGGTFHAFIPLNIWNKVSKFWKTSIEKKLNNEYSFEEDSIEESLEIDGYTFYFYHEVEEDNVVFDSRFPGGTTFDFGLSGEEIIAFLNMLS